MGGCSLRGVESEAEEDSEEVRDLEGFLGSEERLGFSLLFLIFFLFFLGLGRELESEGAFRKLCLEGMVRLTPVGDPDASSRWPEATDLRLAELDKAEEKMLEREKEDVISLQISMAGKEGEEEGIPSRENTVTWRKQLFFYIF